MTIKGTLHTRIMTNVGEAKKVSSHQAYVRQR